MIFVQYNVIMTNSQNKTGSYTSIGMSSTISFSISVSHEPINLICCACINTRSLAFSVANGDASLTDLSPENLLCLPFRGSLTMTSR